MASSDESKPESKSITFLFETAHDYRIVAANGIWGGLTIRGDLLLDFIIDATTTPEQVENAIVGDTLGDEISRFPPEKSITRIRQVGVLLSLTQAESCAHFILEKVKLMRDASSKDLNAGGQTGN